MQVSCPPNILAVLVFLLCSESFFRNNEVLVAFLDFIDSFCLLGSRRFAWIFKVAHYNLLIKAMILENLFEERSYT